MNDSIFMETTKIDPSKTAGEITACLTRYGAQSVTTEFSAGQISGISFRMNMGQGFITFKLPCRWEAVEAVLKQRRKRSVHGNRAAELELQARRIAWRQILRWVEAQMAMVETNMVKLQEVFLPYLMDPRGQTLFEKIESTGFLLENKSEVPS